MRQRKGVSISALVVERLHPVNQSQTSLLLLRNALVEQRWKV
jgi:hypothetical protein